MSVPEIKYCPGTLSEGFSTYSLSCLNKVFNGKKVSHLLPYDSPTENSEATELFLENQKRISISGVQEKVSIVLEKNQIRLAREGEQGTHILKPIPRYGKRSDQIPANEHLTMQLAKQVFKIPTAENALIFFRNGDPAYITKRFDVDENLKKLAQEDFASLAGRTAQTDGAHYKYKGNYLDLFHLMKTHLPAYNAESLKLFKLLIFNYLFSNGDAHLKNFSLSENRFGDFVLSPAYDLLNSRIHIEDSDFALEEGLLPKSLGHGKMKKQFQLLAQKAEIKEKLANNILTEMMDKSEAVEKLVLVSYLDKKTKANYLQAYQKRLKRLSR